MRQPSKQDALSFYATSNNELVRFTCKDSVWSKDPQVTALSERCISSYVMPVEFEFVLVTHTESFKLI